MAVLLFYVGGLHILFLQTIHHIFLYDIKMTQRLFDFVYCRISGDFWIKIRRNVLKMGLLQSGTAFISILLYKAMYIGVYVGINGKLSEERTYHKSDLNSSMVIHRQNSEQTRTITSRFVF